MMMIMITLCCALLTQTDRQTHIQQPIQTHTDTLTRSLTHYNIDKHIHRRILTHTYNTMEKFSCFVGDFSMH